MKAIISKIRLDQVKSEYDVTKTDSFSLGFLKIVQIFFKSYTILSVPAVLEVTT